MDQHALKAQQTVTVRVQVIDMQSFTLDLRLPTYLPVRDLTQRIARDAGLDAYWSDGRRRLYWLRARGRVMADQENLGDLGVINGELVYLLPEPPAGSGVAEQPPEYPENRGYAGSGTAALIGSILFVILWALGWGMALSVDRSAWTVMAPGLAMGLLCVSFARHGFGGAGSAPRVALTAIIIFIVTLVLAFLAPWVINGDDLGTVYSESAPGLIAGMIGVMTGWLAWWGAVEPLPPAQIQAVEEAVVAVNVPCHICGMEVSHDVRHDCKYGCGRSFHTGCHNAKDKAYRGDPRLCSICNVRIG